MRKRAICLLITVKSNPYGIVAYEFYKNGKQVKYEENYEYGYTAIRVDQDIDEVYIYCKNFNNINEYIPVNVYWISDKVIDQCFSRLASEDHFENVLVSGEDLSADITINNEKNGLPPLFHIIQAGKSGIMVK